MNTTLSERLKEAMKGPPKVTGRALAQACGISAPSVSDWLTGKSKSMVGPNLIAAAELLKVRPKWLAEGIGPMRDDRWTPTMPACEPSVEQLPIPKIDNLTRRLLTLFSQLDRDGKRELLERVEFFVAGRRPHQNGNASALAGK
jgi:transcriptional regulator with XRE-family HTH domain